MASARAQGSTEYLVLLAALMVVGLIAITLLSSSSSTSEDSRLNDNRFYWKSVDPISITDVSNAYYTVTTLSGETTDGSVLYFRVKNTGPRPIRITRILSNNGYFVPKYEYYSLSGDEYVPPSPPVYVNIAEKQLNSIYLPSGAEACFGNPSLGTEPCVGSPCTPSYVCAEHSIMFSDGVASPNPGEFTYVLGGANPCNEDGTGTFQVDGFGFEYIVYTDSGTEITKKFIGSKPLIAKCAGIAKDVVLGACASDGNSCIDSSECCGGYCESHICTSNPTCSQDGVSCSSGSECCNGYCVNYVCSSSCGEVFGPGNVAFTCINDNDCCGGHCTEVGPGWGNRCTSNGCLGSGSVCISNSSCCSGNCVFGSVNGYSICSENSNCISDGLECSDNSVCCSGYCVHGRCATDAGCLGNSVSCGSDLNCCSGQCLNINMYGYGSCSTDSGCLESGYTPPNWVSCSSDSDCCSGHCTSNGFLGATCTDNEGCLDEGLVCMNNSECCSGSCINSWCVSNCTSDGEGCAIPSECCGGYCNDGVCSSENCIMCTAPSANDINAVAVSIASVDIDIQAISARVTELQGQIQGGGLSPEIIAAIKSEIQALQAEVANYQSVLNAQSAQLALLQSTADSGTACCSSPECTGNSCCTSSEACASLDGLKLQILALQSEIANLQSDVDALNALIIYVLNL